MRGRYDNNRLRHGVPRRRHARRRPRNPRFHLYRAEFRQGKGHRAHPRSRGSYRRTALSSRAREHTDLRHAADARTRRQQAQGAQPVQQGKAQRSQRRRHNQTRLHGSQVHSRQPQHTRRGGFCYPHTRGHACTHGRLQDRLHAYLGRRDRLLELRAGRRRGRTRASGREHQRLASGLYAHREARVRQPEYAFQQCGKLPHHHSDLRVKRQPRPADHRLRREVRQKGRLLGQKHGQLHGRSQEARLP